MGGKKKRRNRNQEDTIDKLSVKEKIDYLFSLEPEDDEGISPPDIDELQTLIKGIDEVSTGFGASCQKQDIFFLGPVPLVKSFPEMILAQARRPHKCITTCQA